MHSTKDKDRKQAIYTCLVENIKPSIKGRCYGRFQWALLWTLSNGDKRRR